MSKPRNTHSRRTILAGAAALPLLPAAALAAPVTLPLLQVTGAVALALPDDLIIPPYEEWLHLHEPITLPDDPVIAAYPEWQAIRADYLRKLDNYTALERRYGNCSPESDAYHDGPVADAILRIGACERRIANMVATTAAGMAAQLRVLAFAYGAFDKCADDDTEARFIRSLLAGAERMAREDVK